MAKKPSSTVASKSAPAKSPAKAETSAPVSSTAVRNSPVPAPAKGPSTPKAPVTYEAIAYRAFELYQHGRAGSEMDHWIAAESELRGN